MSKNLYAASENVQSRANEMQQKREQRGANSCLLRHRKRRLDEAPGEPEQRSESLQVLIRENVSPVNGENPRGTNSAMNDAPPKKPSTFWEKRQQERERTKQLRNKEKENESIENFSMWNDYSKVKYRAELVKLKKSHAPTMPNTPSSNTPHRNEEEDVGVPLTSMAMLVSLFSWHRPFVSSHATVFDHSHLPSHFTQSGGGVVPRQEDVPIRRFPQLATMSVGTTADTMSFTLMIPIASTIWGTPTTGVPTTAI